MSTTRDWMHGGEDWTRPRERSSLHGIVVLWVMGLVVTAFAAVAFLNG